MMRFSLVWLLLLFTGAGFNDTLAATVKPYYSGQQTSTWKTGPAAG
jgi:hypothetical protein